MSLEPTSNPHRTEVRTMKTNLSTISVTVMPTTRLSINAASNCDTGGGGGCNGGGGGGGN